MTEKGFFKTGCGVEKTLNEFADEPPPTMVAIILGTLSGWSEYCIRGKQNE